MSSEKAASGNGTGGSSEDENSFWGVADGEIDESLAEEHASKIFALWELGEDFQQKIAPASGDKADDGEGGWSADAPAEAAKPAAEPKKAAIGKVDPIKKPLPKRKRGINKTLHMGSGAAGTAAKAAADKAAADKA
ncbi:MAG: hypothetical protein KC619_20230, partial [Myxococcales bacterium]|nr:hypothetical protein [Myxococcales bacterium]